MGAEDKAGSEGGVDALGNVRKVLSTSGKQNHCLPHCFRAPFKAIQAEMLNATMLMFWPLQSFFSSSSSDEIDKDEVRKFCGATLEEKRASKPGKQGT